MPNGSKRQRLQRGRRPAPLWGKRLTTSWRRKARHKTNKSIPAWDRSGRVLFWPRRAATWNYCYVWIIFILSSFILLFGISQRDLSLSSVLSNISYIAYIVIYIVGQRRRALPNIGIYSIVYSYITLPCIALLYNMHCLLIVSRETYIVNTLLVVFGCQVKCLDSSLPWTALIRFIVVKL